MSKTIEKSTKFKRLFFDLEVSANQVFSWNVGYDIKIDYDNIIKERAIICVCWKWEGEKTVHSLQWNKGDDKKLIQDFAKVINSADEVVGHNSNKFDLKWFRTRCLYHGITALPQFKSIDTLRIARDKFNFNSNRLDYISKFLGFGGKIKTDFDLWKDIVLNNDPKAMQDMVTYCKKDVALLEKIYQKLSGYTTHKTHIGVHNGKEKCSCPHCSSTKLHRRGTEVSAAGLKKVRMQCQNCGKYFSLSQKASEEGK